MTIIKYGTLVTEEVEKNIRDALIQDTRSWNWETTEAKLVVIAREIFKLNIFQSNKEDAWGEIIVSCFRYGTTLK